MGLRHLGRETALKTLYQMDISGDAWNVALAGVLGSFPVDERACEFAHELVEGVDRERDALDRKLDGVIEHWSISRLSRVDHNILRLALYELVLMGDIPARVTIDEAIELARTYGDSESPAFVNGVLDRAAEKLGLKGKGDEPAENRATDR